MSSNPRNSSLVQELRRRLRQMDHSGTQPAPAGTLSSTGIAALDALLSPEAFRAGMIVEWIMEEAGSGTLRLALPGALQALQNGGALVVIDDRREFYPPAAACLGLELDRTIVVRPRNPQETIWALEQTLRCAGVAATLGWIDKIPDRVFRRLQLAVEQGGGLGLLMRPATARQEPTWADLRWLVQPLPGNVRSGLNEVPVSLSSGRRLRVELLYCRGGTSGRALQLEICDETGAVRLVPPLAAPANLSRAAGA